MKPIFISLALAFCATPLFAQAPASIQLKDDKDKVSYSIGLDMGATFKKSKIDVNSAALLAGLNDAISGAKPQLNEEQVKTVMTNFQSQMMEKQTSANKEAATKNTAEGEKFLAENKTKEGVKTTASGLQYKVIKEGSGASPKETDTVEVNYAGKLIDGKEFDSSYKRGQSISFPVNGVIKGWTEALQLMKPGSKYQLFIPGNLAYGERGAGADIGPNATLIFDVELIGVKSAGAPDKPQSN